jgi:aryl-alcohol dehydrogenase-like predicted oxidoreductase
MTITRLPQRRVGSLTVGAQGLGCLGMTEFYGPVDDREAVRTIHRALELGANLLDTADVYGHGANEELIGRAIAGRRDTAVLSTKFGVVRPDSGVGVAIRGDRDTVRRSCEASLRRLGTDHIDVYTLTRVDTSVPIEDTVGALAELVADGKIREIGLSEVSVATLRRAHAVHPVATLQTEWSLWSRDIEHEILPACRELGVTVVPYAPLGRGFLTARIRSVGQLAADDFRRIGLPRFTTENLRENLALVDRVAALAAEQQTTAAQWALAWLHHQGRGVIPIPGAKCRVHLEENVDAAFLTLSTPCIAAMEAAVPRAAVRGERWNEHSMSFIGR